MSRSAESRKLAAVIAADAVGYSRLVRGDESGTLEAIQRIFDEIVQPTAKSAGGKIVKTMGDGYLIEFGSAIDAVTCATTWQQKVENESIQFRIGIHLGEVFSDGKDIFGDCVNIASRLEEICPPGRVCVSDMVRAAVGSQIDFQMEDFGSQELKNIDAPVHAYLASQVSDAPGLLNRKPDRPGQSSIQYCLSRDGTSIAYAQAGNGYPLVWGGAWMTHLEWDWDSPSTGEYLSHLSRHFTVIRYDQRGNGMSDWDDVEIEFEKMVDDLEAVINQFDFDKFALLGRSQAASVCMAYINRHPEKISHLVLNGGYARGRRMRGQEKDRSESEALVNMIRHGWAAENPAFRQTMTSLFMPDATPEEEAWFNDFQKACGPSENMARFREMFDEMDVSHLLADIDVPTLIIHSDEDAIAPLSEGRFLASRIRNAEFVMLKSKNHMMFENEPDFPKLIDNIKRFVP